MANTFIEDLASRLPHRVQISSDALRAGTDAVERAFGAEVDYGSIVKTFTHTDLAEQRRYSPPDVMHVKRFAVKGNPICRSDFHKSCRKAKSHVANALSPVDPFN
jgi:hypothetical protein